MPTSPVSSAAAHSTKHDIPTVELLCKAVESAANAIVITDRDGIILWVNPAFQKLTGYGAAEAVGQNTRLLKSGKHDAEHYRKLWTTILSGQIFCEEMINRRKDGTLYHEKNTITPVRGANGEIEHFIAVKEDVTEQKRAAEALRESEARYRELVELSPDPIFIQSEGRFAFINHAGLLLFGASGPEDLLGQPILDRVHPDFREIVRERIRAMPGPGGCVSTIEEKYLRLDGSEVDVEVAAAPFWLNGKVAAQVIARDITARKRAEATARSAKQRLRILFEFAPDAYYLTDLQGRIVDGNKAAEQMTGYLREELIGKNLLHLNLLSQQDLAKAATHLETNREGRATGPEEFEFRTKAGERLVVEIRTYPVEIAGEVLVLGIARDITRRRELEAQLYQAQKMEAIGTLAGGIAHDFNNILGAMIGYTGLAMMDIKETGVQSNLQQVLKAGDRAKDLVSQILTFSRRQKQERRPMQLQPVIEEAIQLLRATLPANIEIVTRLEAAAPSVLADPTRIHQVLMNLCTNAAHAVGSQPGRLEVGLHSVKVTDEAQVHPGLRPGHYARLAVSDTGRGMNARTVKRIFDPFFTTKDPSLGTGLGLAVVDGIVKEHEGMIQVNSEPGQGTTFHVYFPAHQAGADRLGPPLSEMPGGQGEHILLIEDETALAEITARTLRRLGYRVTVETDPICALDLFGNRPRDFDLVLTDLTMPRMSGVDMAIQMLRRRPGIPVLLATGFSNSWDRNNLQSLGIRDLLLKPLSPASLGQAVREALHSPGSGTAP